MDQDVLYLCWWVDGGIVDENWKGKKIKGYRLNLIIIEEHNIVSIIRIKTSNLGSNICKISKDLKLNKNSTSCGNIENFC